MANVTERDESAAVDVLDRWKNEWSLEETESEWHKHVNDSLRHHIACAVSEARVAEWQPIETAPKGTEVLMLKGNGKYAIADWGRYCEYNGGNFTHWMPLPDSPEVK
jgi:hypothetical protein